MSGADRGLLDTSVFIAREGGRPLDVDKLPAELAISVVTLGELHAGVLGARDTDIRARRLATLGTGLELLALPIDQAVALQWARLRVLLSEESRRVNVNDSWIAATALVHGVSVVTQDADFDLFADVAGLQVVRV